MLKTQNGYTPLKFLIKNPEIWRNISHPTHWIFNPWASLWSSHKNHLKGEKNHWHDNRREKLSMVKKWLKNVSKNNTNYFLNEHFEPNNIFDSKDYLQIVFIAMQKAKIFQWKRNFATQGCFECFLLLCNPFMVRKNKTNSFNIVLSVLQNILSSFRFRFKFLLEK